MNLPKLSGIQRDIQTGLQVDPRQVVSTGTPRKVGPATVVIFGATGDLASRKLIPALYNLSVSRSLPERFQIIGFSRGVPDAATWRARLAETTARHSRTPFDAAAWARFAACIDTVAGDITDAEAYSRLAARLETCDTDGNTLFYLSTPASAFPVILPHMQAAGLIQPPGKVPWTRVIVEKPFGQDLASARSLNTLAQQVLDESQIFRIDHYLGKESVQNLMVLRFGNSIFEPLWNHHYVDHVEITGAESIGIEGRGRFYEETGVLRDIVQNHLLQVLALVAMEPPISFNADEIRDMKAQVLRALRPLRPIGEDVVFGQYRGYRDERDVAPDSRTATYVALRGFIDNWRWQGVPFYIRAGKALASRLTEVRVVFKSIPHCLFGSEDLCLRLEPNAMVIRLQPDEGISLGVSTKVPGEDFAVAGVKMDFRYSQGFSKAPPEAYERLLLDAMRGDATLFARRDEVEHAWRYVTPLLDAMASNTALQPEFYEPGSQGPKGAVDIAGQDGNGWERLG